MRYIYTVIESISNRRDIEAPRYEMNGESEQSTDGDEQYGSIETGGGDTVIYDRTNEHAWVQSSHTVEVEA